MSAASVTAVVESLGNGHGLYYWYAQVDGIIPALLPKSTLDDKVMGFR